MIKTGLKNFVNNLKYVLVILGAMFIGLLFGVYGLVTVATRGFETLSTDITNVATEVTASQEDVKNAFVEAFTEIDFDSGNIDEVSSKIISEEFWKDKVISKLKDNISNIEPYIEQVGNDIVKIIEEITHQIILTFIFMAIGLFAGYLLSHYLIHKDNTKGKIFKTLLATILDSVIAVGLIVLATYLISIWSSGFLLIALSYVIIYNILTLIESYIMQGKGKVKFNEIFNFKNAILLFLSNIVITMITVVIIVILFLLTNILVALFVAVPLILVAIITNLVTAESYVSNYVKQKENVK